MEYSGPMVLRCEGTVVSRIFLSHSSADWREAVALKAWLAGQDPPLANEIFLDLDRRTGIATGVRWKDALKRANARCEAVICLVSERWDASSNCRTEYLTAENLNKQIFCVRLEPTAGQDITAEWQRCDLFGDGTMTSIEVPEGPPVQLATDGLLRLRDGIRGAGIGAESFVWPPPADVDREPYRGWEPFDEVDAGVFSAAAPRSCAHSMRSGGCVNPGWKHCSWFSARPERASRRSCAQGCCRGCAARTAGICHSGSSARNRRC